jgi:hypothetical protein
VLATGVVAFTLVLLVLFAIAGRRSAEREVQLTSAPPPTAGDRMPEPVTPPLATDPLSQPPQPEAATRSRVQGDPKAEDAPHPKATRSNRSRAPGEAWPSGQADPKSDSRRSGANRAASARPIDEQRAPAPESPTAPKEPGYLTVGAEPYAIVWIDGRSIGPTPLVDFALAPGEHRVTCLEPDTDRVRLEHTVTVGSGEHRRLTVR